MKTSSASPDPPPIDRAKAWSCLITNLLVLPGLGSMMAKRTITGLLQMGLAFAGFGITVVALIRFLLAWVQEFQLPEDPRLYHTAIAGLAIFAASWLWSLATSLALFRKRD
jgi:hypothetical protein